MTLEVTSVWPYFFLLTYLFFLGRILSPFTLSANASFEQNESLESLRGLLAIGVMVHHAVITFYFFKNGEWASPPTFFYTFLGGGSVILFFFLSAYLFWGQCLRDKGIPDHKKYFSRRVRRILPAYYFAVLIITVVVAFTSRFELKVPFRDLMEQLGRWLTVGVPRGHFPDINGVPNTGLIIAGVAWTLRYEVLFYLALPILAVFAMRKHGTLALLAFVSLMYIYSDRIPFDVIRDFGYYMAVGFGFGIATAYFKFYLNNKILNFMRRKVVSVIGLVSLLFVFWFGPNLTSLQQSSLLLPLFAAAACENSFFGFFSLPGLRTLGRMSYSIYLLHGITLYLVARAVCVFYPFASISPWTFWGFVFSCATLTVLASFVVYHSIELKGMKMELASPRRNLARRKRS